jgi:hypothetical protein
VRPIKDEETFQDFTDPDMQVKPDDMPEDFKQRLLSFVPPPVPATEDKREPVETECEVVEDAGPTHLCAECLHVNDQPICRAGLSDDNLKFANDDPEAEVIKCLNFEQISSDNDTTLASNETEVLNEQAGSKRKM